MTDWCLLRQWLQAFLWPNMKTFKLVLSGFTESGSDCMYAQQVWNDACMQRDAALNIQVAGGFWHESFDSTAELDLAVLLEPGFQAYLQSWHATLRILQNMRPRLAEDTPTHDHRVPLVISGQTLWASQTSADNSGDFTLCGPILEDAGFDTIAPQAINPFSAFWKISESAQRSHPVFNDRYMCRNGFLVVVVGKSDSQGLPYRDLQLRACISKAEA